jgi:UDP-glucose 4-epimerase
VWGPLDDLDAAIALLDGCTSLIHLAGPPSVAQSFGVPADFVVAHTAGAATMLQAAARVPTLQRVVLASSAEVYGVPTAEVVSEDDVPEPLSPYAVAKLAAEDLARVMARTYGLEVLAVRPFAVYGPASPPWSLVGTAVSQAMQPESEPVLLLDLNRVRDLVFVDDVADLLVRAATVPIAEAAGRCIALNASTGVGTSVRQLAETALRAAGRTGGVGERPARPAPGASEMLHGGRPVWSDPMRLVGSPNRAAELLGWTPSTDVEAGVAALIAERRRVTQ